MLTTLVAALLAFPPMTRIEDVTPLHFGTPGPASPEAAVAAFDGGALVFWADSRRDRSLGVAPTSARGDLWLMRLDALGAPTSRLGSVGCLSPPGVTASHPRAVATGTGALVAWRQTRQDGGTRALLLAPVRADGAIDCTAAQPVPVPDLVGHDVAFDGRAALLTWTTASGVHTLPYAVVGQQLDAGQPLEFATTGSGARPSTIGLDGGVLVGWVSLQNEALVRGGAQGTVIANLGPAARLELVNRPTGPAAGVLSGGDLELRTLDANGSPGQLAGAVLTGLEDVRLAPTGSEQVLALGWTSGGSAPSVIATPSDAFVSNGPPLPAGRRPLALTALGRGALAVAQVMNGVQGPLVGFTATSGGAASFSWSSEATLTTEANQFTPSVAWAGDAWLVAWNEADQPFVPGVVTHTAELTPAGGLTVTDDLTLPSGDYQGLVAGGGRLAGSTRNPNTATLQALHFSQRELLVQQKLAEAPVALGHAAVGARDALQWSDLSITSYTAQHTVEGTLPRSRSSTGRAGRCAALVGRRFYLPVWNAGALSLLVFDGDDPTSNSSKLVATFGAAGEPACAAANGALLLLAWSTPNGLVAWRYDTLTGLSSRVALPGSDSGDKSPVVAPTTGGWVMVWEADSAAGGHGLRANFVSLAGVADDTSSKVGRSTDFEERRPSLAPAPTGQVALAWSAFDTASGQTRTLVRVIGEAPVRPDAGVPDAGAEDAGAGDAGSPEEDAGTQPADGGTADAGEDAPDGGGPGATEPLVLESCGCAAAQPSDLLALLALLRLARARSRPR